MLPLVVADVVEEVAASAAGTGLGLVPRLVRVLVLACRGPVVAAAAAVALSRGCSS